MVGKIPVEEGTLWAKISERGSVACPINRVVVLQPSYLPWIGYFEQMARADQFVFLDNVQFKKNKGPKWLKQSHCLSMTYH